MPDPVAMQWLRPTLDTVAFHPGEAVESLVVRYALRLGVRPMDVAASVSPSGKSIRAIRRSVASVPSCLASLQALAHIGRFDLEELKRQGLGTGEMFQRGHGVEPTFDRRRVAPGMLGADGADPWVRQLWRFDCLPCDVDTGEVLHHRCHCGAELDWNRCVSLVHCHACRGDLRELTREFVSPSVLATSRMLAKVITNDMPAARDLGLPAELSQMSPADVMSLAYLGAGLERSVHLEGIPVRSLTIGKGMRFLERWPVSVDILIKAYLAAHDAVDPQFGRARAVTELRLKVETSSPEVKSVFTRRVFDALTMDGTQADALLQEKPHAKSATRQKDAYRIRDRSVLGRRAQARTQPTGHDRNEGRRRSA